MGLPHLLVQAAGQRWLPLAYENRRGSRRLRLWWKVIIDVEAAPPRGVIDRRVLTADVDARVGLTTCVRKWSSQVAKLPSFQRSCTQGSSQRS